MHAGKLVFVLIFTFSVSIGCGNGQEPAPSPPPDASVIARGLEIPWALDFLPDGTMIVTERPGRIRLVDENGAMDDPFLTIDEVAHRGEGGLLGITLHPRFETNPFVYVYYTHEQEGDLLNKVVRFRLDGLSLRSPEVIIEGIPAASIHNGGRIKFGPDQLLYITTGDAANSSNSQNQRSLAGKILRLNDDGSIPQDNPFGDSPVYSMGHRNPQGLAWDDTGRLWATEHGSSATDELNLIEAGVNYGWPEIRGDESDPAMRSPVLHSQSDTWAPSGMAFVDGSLLFAGLRGASLYEAELGNGGLKLARHLQNVFGRLRSVNIGPDSMVYITTSNKDGRGSPEDTDDRVIRIRPDVIKK